MSSSLLTVVLTILRSLRNYLKSSRQQLYKGTVLNRNKGLNSWAAATQDSTSITRSHHSSHFCNTCTFIRLCKTRKLNACLYSADKRNYWSLWTDKAWCFHNIQSQLHGSSNVCSCHVLSYLL